MFRLSKKIEYAIIALQYLAEHPGELIAAKEISDKKQISFEFLSKTLQSLLKNGFVQSHQGTRGGYLLNKPAEEILLSDVIAALEERPALVECMVLDANETCGRANECSIKMPMAGLQNQVNQIFKNTTIAALANNK